MGLRRTIATVLATLVVGTGIGIAIPSAAQADGNVGAFLNHLNGLRAAHGLPGLALTADLSAIAQSHSQAMAAQGTIFHNPSLTTQVTNWQTVGENVGMGPSEALIDNAFDNSPPHYANEVNTSYTQVGIGSVTRSDGQIFVTLDFRKPMNAGAAPAPANPAPAAPKPAPVKSPVVQAASGTAEQAAAGQAATDQAAAAAVQAEARAAAHAAADQQAASLTSDLRAGTDPIACAMVFSAHVNTMGQTG
jgi:Cysteine-rich secretory protein family